LRQELQGKGTRQCPIRNLVFAPDRVTRYIPFAALFDGNHYLIENYAVSTTVSAKLTDTRDRLLTSSQEVSVLAMGLSDPVPPNLAHCRMCLSKLLDVRQMAALSITFEIVAG
jgi:CHAT domain-containing protein